MNNLEKTVLEYSTGEHYTQSKGIKILQKSSNMNTLDMVINGEEMVIEHGHHNTVAVDPTVSRCVKITQQEFNPVLKEFNNSRD